MRSVPYQTKMNLLTMRFQRDIPSIDPISCVCDDKVGIRGVGADLKQSKFDNLGLRLERVDSSGIFAIALWYASVRGEVPPTSEHTVLVGGEEDAPAHCHDGHDRIHR